MIKTYLFTKSEVKQDVAIDDWKSLVEEEYSLLWVDVRSLAKEDMDKLSQLFNLHGIAIESCLDRYRRPHLYEFDDHFYVNMTTLKESHNGKDVKPMELHVFVGGKYIITATEDSASPAVDEAQKEYTDTPGLCERGPLYAVYLLAGDLVSSYYPIVDKLDDKADRLESDLLDKADRKALKTNLDLKHETFELRKLLGPQRDIFNDLSRRDFPFIQGSKNVYFQDIYNRMIRIFDMLDTIREILTSNLDIYLSSVSNRLNDIMKILTIFAVILGIFSFITGWFGMNVFTESAVRMPLRDVVWWSIGLGAVITGGLMYWFERKGWL